MLSTPDWPVPPSWPLAKIALESGFNPTAEHPKSHARGLWQCMPIEVTRFPRGAKLIVPPIQHYLMPNSDGTTSLMRKYSCPAPEVQMVEGFKFWLRYRGQGFRCREALYCANIAPARLLGTYDADTIIYSANLEDAPLNNRGPAFVKSYWPEAYKQNAAAFGLDPRDPKGRILLRHLAVGLDAAIRRTQARYDAELTAAYVANARGPLPPAT